ncbi:hypothetical protein [Halovivax gelatinilyticus]|uniref:hypothetical protein n=1 Tax=Halovivax gelatinilyticus TaxID=2961597 RepID=UPI0020CA6BA2|nr:hypothetical protein [Halovivax gelatinilyticus]
MSTNAVVLKDESTHNPPQSADASVEAVEHRIARTERRRVDVTELSADGLQTFIDENVGTHLVSLERRAGRTYLLLE